jgi:hypothetical protein
MEAHTVLQCCACENLVYYIFNLIYIHILTDVDDDNLFSKSSTYKNRIRYI